MHDELIERKLGTVLRDEAASLPFTISAAELERRMALRHRSFAARRLTLLLAAGIAVGAVAVGGALSGLFDQKVATPTPGPTSPVAVVESDAPAPSGPADLPTLDALIAPDPGAVVIAQAHGPTDAWGLPVVGQPRSTVDLGLLDGGPWGSYIVSGACLGSASLQFDVREPGSPSGPIDGPVMPCDGRIHDVQVEVRRQELTFTADGGASWRIVVRGPRQQPSGSVDPEQPLTAEQGEDELTRFSDVLSDEAQPFGDAGWVIQNVGSLLSRERYTIQIRCAAGEPLRVLIGNDFEDGPVIGDETHLACDGGVRVIRQAILEPYGGQVYVAGRPGSRVDLLVTGPVPPIDLVNSLPGWRLSGGIGPDFSFDGSGQGFTGPGIEGGGTILVAMVCTGNQPIKITVDVGLRSGEKQESFIAGCSPEGQLTSQSFEVAGDYVDVVYDAQAPLTWTAMSILVRDNDR